MNKVLYTLCRHAVAIMDSWNPYPSTAIAKYLGYSLYYTRKEIKKLKDLGYVESCMECAVTEEGNYILNGYTITEKAKETKEYKKALKRKIKDLKKRRYLK